MSSYSLVLKLVYTNSIISSKIKQYYIKAIFDQSQQWFIIIPPFFLGNIIININWAQIWVQWKNDQFNSMKGIEEEAGITTRKYQAVQADRYTRLTFGSIL